MYTYLGWARQVSPLVSYRLEMKFKTTSLQLRKFIISSAVVMLVVSLSLMSKWRKEKRGGAYVSLSSPVLQWRLLFHFGAR